jgi:hypothetical protein
MQYTRDLGTGAGIELIKIWEGINSFESADNSTKISIFPNPCFDIANLYFEFDKAVTISVEIYNSNGQKVFNKDFGRMAEKENEVSLNVSCLNSDLYFVRLKTEEKDYIQQLAVQ